MGMRTSLYGIKKVDESKMIAVRQACVSADIGEPEEVTRYFDGDRQISINTAVMPVAGDSLEGWEVDLSALPPEVTHICFENRY